MSDSTNDQVKRSANSSTKKESQAEKVPKVVTENDSPACSLCNDTGFSVIIPDQPCSFCSSGN